MSKRELWTQNWNLNHLVESIFKEVNRVFVLAFENHAQRTRKKRHYFQNVEIKDYKIMINGKNLFGQPVKYDKVTYRNIWKNPTGQGDDYRTGSLSDYN